MFRFAKLAMRMCNRESCARRRRRRWRRHHKLYHSLEPAAEQLLNSIGKHHISYLFTRLRGFHWFLLAHFFRLKMARLARWWWLIGVPMDVRKPHMLLNTDANWVICVRMKWIEELTTAKALGDAISVFMAVDFIGKSHVWCAFLHRAMPKIY